MKKIKWSFSLAVIVLYIIAIPLINFNHHRYRSNDGVIEFDVKSYYAYLPAAFIYHDLTLGFIDQNPEKFNKWIWPVETPTGKKAILTTMGLSVMYTPFFAIGHISAKLSDKYEADGYSYPYHVALQFSGYVYFILALILLRKILRKYFDEIVVAITLLAIGAGTNLFQYVAYTATMPHGYNFLLITLFIYYLERWTEKISLKHTIFLGAISGLVCLIRPTNIVVLVLIPLWQIGSLGEFKPKMDWLLKHWKFIAIMALVFLLVWIPQFAYWKHVSGKFFYFSYGERNDKFFWFDPQIWKILFSYEKGWFLYTPLMFLSVIGIYFLPRYKIKLRLAIGVYLGLMIYILSAWWCWWYGGSFGQRSMIDFYGLMALPLAAIINEGIKIKYWKYVTVTIVAFLIWFNQFNMVQYRSMALSYWWMNKEGYWENFLKSKPTCKYFNVAMHPNYEKARLGIYEPVAPFNRGQLVTDAMLKERIITENRNNEPLLNSMKAYTPNLSSDSLLSVYAMQLIQNSDAEKYFRLIKIDYYKNQINHCETWKKEVEKQAKKSKLAYNEALQLEAERIYNNYSQKYDKR